MIVIQWVGVATHLILYFYVLELVRYYAQEVVVVVGSFFHTLFDQISTGRYEITTWMTECVEDGVEF